MKKALLPTLVCALLSVACLRAEEPKKLEFKTDKDKASYALGQDFANRIKSIATEIDLDAMTASFRDSISGKESKMSEQELDKQQDNFRKFLTAKMMASQGKPATEVKTPPLEDKEKVSYAVGLSMGAGLKPFAEFLNMELLGTAFASAVKGEAVGFNPQDHKEAIDAYFKKVQNDYSEKNKKAGDDFLAENKKKEGVVTTASGLQYKVLKEGKGEKSTGTDLVQVNYEGRLINGKVFDSSAKAGKPFETTLDGVIQGWIEALKLMPAGSKWELYIPVELAYGEAGRAPTIPPNSVLVFSLEVLSIKKQDAPKIEEPKTPKADAPKEAPKADAPKTETK